MTRPCPQPSLVAPFFFPVLQTCLLLLRPWSSSTEPLGSRIDRGRLESFVSSREEFVGFSPFPSAQAPALDLLSPPLAPTGGPASHLCGSTPAPKPRGTTTSTMWGHRRPPPWALPTIKVVTNPVRSCTASAASLLALPCYSHARPAAAPLVYLSHRCFLFLMCTHR
jgi:hypothetical protein